jgi:pimeloyl-ACP methyl ester carboxylesterase
MYRPVRVPWHEELVVRGLRHRLTWWGERSDTPVVLLHGFMDCGTTWQFLVDCLPETWSCVAPDWRGFGATEWVPGGYWYPDYLADLDFLLDALVPNTRARVVAHSMGANIVGLYAGIRPRRLEWFVNLEGIGLPRQEAAAAPERYEQWLHELRHPPAGTPYADVDQLAAVLMKRNALLSQDNADFVAREWITGENGPGITLSFDPRHRVVNPVLYRRDESEACWARIEIPMLLLMGGKSALMPRLGSDASPEYVRAHFPGVRIVELPEVGHLMHFEDPQAVARHVIEFERSVSGK